MSGDDEDTFEGEDEERLRDHFAPVGRSLKRTATSRSMQAYTISFVGIVILSASFGGVIIGTYATFQEDFGLCGNPILEVDPAESSELAEEPVPHLDHLEYEELTPDEQQGFREALNVVNHVEEVEGNIEHLSAFRNGAIVTYHGKEHYVIIASLNECVPVDAFGLPLNIAGLLVGTGLYFGPGLWRRFRS